MPFLPGQICVQRNPNLLSHSLGLLDGRALWSYPLPSTIKAAQESGRKNKKRKRREKKVLRQGRAEWSRSCRNSVHMQQPASKPPFCSGVFPASRVLTSPAFSPSSSTHQTSVSAGQGQPLAASTSVNLKLEGPTGGGRVVCYPPYQVQSAFVPRALSIKRRPACQCVPPNWGWPGRDV